MVPLAFTGPRLVVLLTVAVIAGLIVGIMLAAIMWARALLGVMGTTPIATGERRAPPFKHPLG
jgi:hypothetical protein